MRSAMATCKSAGFPLSANFKLRAEDIGSDLEALLADGGRQAQLGYQNQGVASLTGSVKPDDRGARTAVQCRAKLQ